MKKSFDKVYSEFPEKPAFMRHLGDDLPTPSFIKERENDIPVVPAFMRATLAQVTVVAQPLQMNSENQREVSK